MLDEFIQTVSNLSLSTSRTKLEWLLVAVTIQNQRPSIVVSLTRSDVVDAGMTVERVLSLILNAIGIMTNGSSILKHSAESRKTNAYL